MMPCDNCRTLLLDHLYGLLDAAEAVAVENHLAACPACTAVRDREVHAQELFAQAAKVEFPHVRFQPPAEEAADLGQKVEVVANIVRMQSTPAPIARSPINSWLGWAVAASVLFGIAASAWTLERRKDVAAATRTECGSR